jgi:L-ascorbate metabolism protein UlaG (beta-lactamase superfamily)
VFIGPGVLAEKVQGLVVLHNGESKTIDGMSFEAVPMYNLQRGPSAGKLYHDKGVGNGYVIGLADKRLYVSGDTECIPEMRELKKIDIAFVCMNLPYTMTPEEASQCTKQFRPTVVYPYHYRGTDLRVFQQSLAPEANIEVRLRNWY